jgi:hypothetical protein
MQYETLQVSGALAIQTLKDLRSAYRSTGKYPFLIGDADDLAILQENSEDNESEFEEIIESSSSVRIQEYIEAKKSADRERRFAPPLGNWPRTLPEQSGLTIHTDVFNDHAKPQVYLGLAEIAAPWQLPAVVAFGGWNECPWADVHCAFHREWQQSHGAEIAGISGSILECLVSNPPSTQADALNLAWQQYYYCRDIVEQGCQSISQLAATLINSPTWFFWWD